MEEASRFADSLINCYFRFERDRVPFSLPRSELATAQRGAIDLNRNSVIAASRSAALAEDAAIFHGFPTGDVAGITASTPHKKVMIGNDDSHYPEYVAQAVSILRAPHSPGGFQRMSAARVGLTYPRSANQCAESYSASAAGREV